MNEIRNIINLLESVEQGNFDNDDKMLIPLKFNNYITDIKEFIQKKVFNPSDLKSISFDYQSYSPFKQKKLNKNGTYTNRNNSNKPLNELNELLHFIANSNNSKSIVFMFSDSDGDFSEIFAPDNIFQPSYFQKYKNKPSITIYREGDNIVIDTTKKLKDIT